MRCVANPIHERQRKSGRKSIAIVILDDNTFPRYSACLLEQCKRIAGMMKHVNEDYRIEALVGMRNQLTVVLHDRNLEVASQENVDSVDRNVGPLIKKKFGDRSVATTHIKNFRACGNHLTKVARKDFRAPMKDQQVVQLANHEIVRAALGRFIDARGPEN